MKPSFFDRLLPSRFRRSAPQSGDTVPPHLLEPIRLDGTPEELAAVRPGETLPDAVAAEADRFAELGNARMEEGAYVDALAAFRQGLEILPPPRYRWEAAEWFLAGIGDALWFLKCHLNAVPIWNDMLLHGAVGKGWVHLRRGQTLYELGDFKEAESELMRALLLEGQPLFEGEDRKYWNYITSRARPPEGWTSWEGWTGAEPGSQMYEWLMNLDLYEYRSRPQN
ncbi:MAG: hypothetical protein ACJ8GN_20505 [Longimicrobiaceae bacterium]